MNTFGPGCLTCGHGEVSHYTWGVKPCSMTVYGCGCRRFVMPGVMPAEGERPVFGTHRLPPSEAATAPAWRLPSEAQVQARHVQRLRAWARSQHIGH